MRGMPRGVGVAQCYPHLGYPAPYRLPHAVSWGVPTLFTTCPKGSTLGVYTLGVSLPARRVVAPQGARLGVGGGINKVWLRKEWEGPSLGASCRLVRAPRGSILKGFYPCYPCHCRQVPPSLELWAGSSSPDTLLLATTAADGSSLCFPPPSCVPLVPTVPFPEGLQACIVSRRYRGS